jgi:hypothetical protein
VDKRVLDDIKDSKSLFETRTPVTHTSLHPVDVMHLSVRLSEGITRRTEDQKKITIKICKRSPRQLLKESLFFTRTLISCDYSPLSRNHAHFFRRNPKIDNNNVRHTGIQMHKQLFTS